MRTEFLHVFVFVLAAALVAGSCFSKRERGEKDPVGETTNQAVNSLLDGDDEFVEKDEKFITEVMASNKAEIEFAKLALEKSENDAVKDLARMLEADHSSALNSLKEIAAEKSMKTPGESGEEAKEKLEALKKEKTGGEFDEEWLEKMKEMHEESVNTLQTFLSETNDRKIKIWINETLPVIKGHLEKVNTVEQQVN